MPPKRALHLGVVVAIVGHKGTITHPARGEIVELHTQVFLKTHDHRFILIRRNEADNTPFLPERRGATTQLM